MVRDGLTAFIAAGLAAPAVALAAMLTAVETHRTIEPHAALFGGPPPVTLAQSIVDGFGVEQTYQFIRGGQDPNLPVRIDDEDYTGGAAIEVSPLMLAVAAGDSSAVRMLFAFGARLDLPQNRYAECLARELPSREIETILAEHRDEGRPEAPCTTRPADAPTPLAAWTQAAEAYASDRR